MSEELKDRSVNRLIDFRGNKLLNTYKLCLELAARSIFFVITVGTAILFYAICNLIGKECGPSPICLEGMKFGAVWKSF